MSDDKTGITPLLVGTSNLNLLDNSMDDTLSPYHLLKDETDIQKRTTASSNSFSIVTPPSSDAFLDLMAKSYYEGTICKALLEKVDLRVDMTTISDDIQNLRFDSSQKHLMPQITWGMFSKITTGTYIMHCVNDGDQILFSGSGQDQAEIESAYLKFKQRIEASENELLRCSSLLNAEKQITAYCDTLADKLEQVMDQAEKDKLEFQKQLDIKDKEIKNLKQQIYPPSMIDGGNIHPSLRTKSLSDKPTSISN
jgi:plasmid maintenance system antidote protein VapI